MEQRQPSKAGTALGSLRFNDQARNLTGQQVTCPLQQDIAFASYGTMTADSSDEASGGVDAGVGEGNADSPSSSIKLASIS